MAMLSHERSVAGVIMSLDPMPFYSQPYLKSYFWSITLMRISFELSLSFLNLKMQFHSQEFWETMLSSDKSCSQISVERIWMARYLSSGSLARFLNSRMELSMSINFLFF